MASAECGVVAHMGFLSKLFGGDTDTPSSQPGKAPRSRAMPTEPPRARAADKKGSPDEEPTADHTHLANKRRAALRAPALPTRTGPEPQPARRPPPLAPSRAGNSGKAAEETTRRDVATLGDAKIREANRTASNKSQRPRASRKRSPGFYSVSTLEAISESKDPKTAKVEISIASPERAPAVEHPPPADAESQFSEVGEETNPGLGYAKSRHDPQQLATLPAADAELLAYFAVELAMNQSVGAWLPRVSDALGELISVARVHNRDEWVKPLRAMSQLLGNNQADELGPIGKNRTPMVEALAELEAVAPLPFKVDEQCRACEGLIVEQVLAEVPGVDSSTIQKIQRKKLDKLEFWQNLNSSELSKHFSQQPDWFDAAQEGFLRYSQRRSEQWLSAVIMGKKAAIGQQLNALSSAGEAFQAACDDDDSARRRETRRKRQEQANAAILLLAEFGEVDILREVEHSSVQMKIERLGQWLSDLKSAR